MANPPPSYLKESLIKLSQETRLHRCPNPLIGLTGGIATGKSTVTHLFKERGLWPICADQLIHQIYREEATLNKVSSLCPQAIQSQGTIDFKVLRTSFFNSPEIKKELESFLYARLPMVFKEALPSDTKQVVVYDVPLLFEKQMESQFDLTIVVYTSEQTQLERLSLRDGTDLDTHKKIIQAQWPLSKKRELAHYSIENNKGPDQLRKRAFELLDQILQ